jgi:hypothetical protein
MTILAGLLAAIGCQQQSADPPHKKVTSEDVRRDADRATETAVEYSRQTKEEIEKKFDNRLKELDGEIATLREKGRDRTGEAKVKWDRKMTELEAKRDAARAELAKVRDSSEAAWKDLRKGAQSSWDDLDKAVREALREF